MKQLIINGQPVGSIWKTETPATKTPKNAKTQSNSKHEGGKNAALFIPQSYSDPTASAAIGNIMREQELEQRRQKRKHKGKRRKKRHPQS